MTTRRDNELSLAHKQLETVPTELAEPDACRKLTALDLSGNGIGELPQRLLQNLTSLESLVAQNNRIATIPGEIRFLIHLKILKLDQNVLGVLPQTIGDLPALEVLSLGKNCLLSLPMSIAGLGKTLAFLNLSSNNIKLLPPEIGALTKLQKLYLDHNSFCSLPASITKCALLEELSVDWLCYTSYAVTHVKAGELKEVLAVIDKISQHGRRSEIDAMQAISAMSTGPFDVNAKDVKNSRTWLHMAAKHNHISVIQTLLKHGANVSALDKDRYSPLCLAIKHHNLDSVMALLKAGADIHEGGGPFGTALHMATIKCELWLVKELIKRGANVNAADEETRNTPLHQLFASFDRAGEKAAAVAEALILAGAEPNVKNLEGWAPIHIASKKGQSKAIKWIVRNNGWIKETTGTSFDLNITGGSDKWTALHLAGHAGHYKLVQTLISAGADLFAKNSDLRSPRQASKGNLAISKLFRRAEAHEAQTRLGPREASGEEPSHSGINTRFSSPAKRIVEVRGEANFVTEIDDFSPRPFGPKREIMLRLSGRKAGESVVSLAEHQECDGIVGRITCATYRGRCGGAINAYYLRDKILNNTARLHERYDALNSLKANPAGVQVGKVFAEILARLMGITSQGLQLDLIHAADVIVFPGIIPALEALLHECGGGGGGDKGNQVIRREVESALEEVKAAMVRGGRVESRGQFSTSARFPKGQLLGLQRPGKYDDGNVV